MAPIKAHEKINYVELPTRDIGTVKTFFSAVFGWTFVDYGPEYSAFYDAGLNGGFYHADKESATESGSALVVFYSRDLESTQEKIERSGGTIKRPTFTFPGGRRFHFCDPNGNEYAVWSDKYL